MPDAPLPRWPDRGALARGPGPLAPRIISPALQQTNRPAGDGVRWCPRCADRRKGPALPGRLNHFDR